MIDSAAAHGKVASHLKIHQRVRRMGPWFVSKRGQESESQSDPRSPVYLPSQEGFPWI